jgi:hypothetical protein
MGKDLRLRNEYQLGFINCDSWEVEHEGDYVGLLSVGHNRRIAKFNTKNMLTETVIINAELAADAPKLLEVVRKISDFLINNEDISDKIPVGILKDLGIFTDKYFDVL